MAGTIVTDRIESDASYNSVINIASTLVVSGNSSFSRPIFNVTLANTTTITGPVNASAAANFTGAVNASANFAASGVLTLNSADKTLKIEHSGGDGVNVYSSGGETVLRLYNYSTNGRKYAFATGGTGGSYAGGRLGIYGLEINQSLLEVTSATGGTAGGTTGKGVGFGHAGFWIDRGWANQPSFSVMQSSATGETDQAQIRIHGTNANWTSYPGASGTDFSCGLQIDGAVVSTSDRRRKKNISSIDNALDIIKLIDGKRFQLKNSDGDTETGVSQNDYKFGFIGQDLQEAGVDELYKHNPNEDDGTEGWNRAYTVDYSSLVAVLVNAMKEQQEQIDTLKAEVDLLKGV
jgi:trimeric autotransporter adhesin